MLKKLEEEDIPIIPISTVSEEGLVKLKMEVKYHHIPYLSFLLVVIEINQVCNKMTGLTF